MSEFQKITAITPSFSSKTNALLDEIMADVSLMNELHALGISDQEIPHYVTLLISYLDSKKICSSCKGLLDCQSDTPYMARSLSMSSSGRLSSCLGPCKFKMAEITKDMNFLYRDFDPEWNSLSLAAIKVERAKELRMAMTKCAKKDSAKKWCYVKGESGSGKSYYLAAFANAFASKGKTVAFIDTNKRFDELKNYAIVFKNFFFTEMFETWYVGTNSTPVRHLAENVDFLTMLWNTLVYAGVGGLIFAVTPAITAYLTCKYHYKLSTIINAVFTLILAIPIVGALPSELTWLRQLGIYDSLWGNFLRYLSGAGMYYFVYFAFFKSMSDAYREAAEIDGASDLTIMLRIYFPMALKTIGTVFLIQFIALWNDWQSEMVYLPTHPTLARAVYEMSLGKSDIGTGLDKGALASVPVKMAASMMLAFPITVIFIVFRNKLMGNVSVGGLKE